MMSNACMTNNISHIHVNIHSICGFHDNSAYYCTLKFYLVIYV